ncbi:MAG: radical SAM protein [Verrucomicrobia bacterium]|nr:radical SAM protein [Verrucomicrobiota bacterium]
MKIPYPLNRLLLGLGRERGVLRKVHRAAQRLGGAARAARALLFLPDRPPMPIRIQIENTNRCNLQCIMCGRQYRAVFNKDMPNDVFHRLMKEIRPAYLTINGDGEPLLDGGLPEKIRAAKQWGCVISMPTNMTLMNEERARAMAKSGLDLLTVSLDGATKESYEAIRVGARFESVLENIRRFQEISRAQKAPPPPELRVLFVLQQKNLFDYEACLALQRRLGIKVQLVPVKYLDRAEIAAVCASSAETLARLEAELTPRLSAEAPEDARELYERWLNVAKKACAPAGPGRVCFKPWSTAYVDAQGDVYPCCLAVDAKQSLKMGNVASASFKDVWHGERYRAYRRDMLHRRDDVPICAECPAGDEGLQFRFSRWFRWLPAPLHRAWKGEKT